MTTEFFEDLEIFITGGSGVVGKAVIEKLLRSCNVRRIYVLLRCKKGVGVKDRLEQMKNSKIFNVLKQRKPNELDKLVAIPGDTALDGLGISPVHRETLTNVSVFIHSAATIRFSEPLKTAISLNIKSTLESLKIAETLENLKIFIYVSTFYSNPYLNFIEDKVYPALFDWRTAIKMLDSSHDQMDPLLHIINEKIIAGFRNTYLFTKHLSEQLVNDYRHKVPVGIFRPSIVVTAIKEPEPAFTETAYGVMGHIAVWTTGFLKVLHCNYKTQLDFTPLDACTKTLLIFTAKTAKLQRHKLQDAIPVAMFSSYGLYHGNNEVYEKSVTKAARKYACEKAIWIPGVKITMCPFIFQVYNFFFHLVPAFFGDVLLRILNRKPFMMKLQRQAWVASQHMSFALRKTFKSTGPTDFENMLQTEKGTDFDMTVFNNYSNENALPELLSVVVKGCRRHVLKEDDSTLPRCRRVLKMKLYAYKILRLTVLCVLLGVIYTKVLKYTTEWN